MRVIPFVLALLLSIPVLAEEAVDGLLPIPLNVQEKGEGIFVMKDNVRITYDDKSLQPVAKLFASALERINGIASTVTFGKAKKNAISLSIDAANSLLPDAKTYGVSPKIVASLSAATQQAIPDERYAVNVSKKSITVVGASAEGVFRGCTTLLQMVCFAGESLVPSRKQRSLSERSEGERNPHGIETAFPAGRKVLPCTVLTDCPTFAWRGLSLDISRCFIPADDIKTVIDILALYKMNVLHLHLNDNQGWRIEVKGYPELTANDTVQGRPLWPSANESYLTQAQYTDIVRYAADRFITIVPELDLPGHSNDIFKAYPQAVNAAKLPFELNLPGQALACLDPDDEPTMQMVGTAIRQIAALTPGRFIHIGADETFGMQDDKYQKFVHRIRSLVHSLGKEVVGWQEMSRAEVAEGDIIQNWIAFSRKQIAAQAKRAEVAKHSKQSSSIPQEVREYLGRTYKKAPQDIPTAISKGAKILLSPQAFCYLDCPYEEESIDPNQKDERDRLGLQQYTRQNLKDMYDWNPIRCVAAPSDTLTKGNGNTSVAEGSDATKHIAGIEAAIWGESIHSFSDMQFLLLPRLTGVAEKAWGATNNTSWETYRQQLSFQSPLWRKLNWNFFKSSLVDWK